MTFNNTRGTIQRCFKKFDVSDDEKMISVTKSVGYVTLKCQLEHTKTKEVYFKPNSDLSTKYSFYLQSPTLQLASRNSAYPTLYDWILVIVCHSRQWFDSDVISLALQ